MGMIAYPPVYNAARIIQVRKTIPVTRAQKPKIAIDQAVRAAQAVENMNRIGFKMLRSRFMPAVYLDIVKDVAQRRGVSIMLIAADSRKKAVVRARNEAMYLIKQKRPQLSAPRIGRWFDRDHTSVLHGIASHAAKNGLPALVGYDYERVRRRNAAIADRKRASQTNTMNGGRQ